jgi:hypothetical protein
MTGGQALGVGPAIIIWGLAKGEDIDIPAGTGYTVQTVGQSTVEVGK